MERTLQRIALHVDELIGNQEIVVKTVNPQLARVPGVAGATVLADGSIVLIANPVQANKTGVNVLGEAVDRRHLRLTTGAKAVIFSRRPSSPACLSVAG